MLTRLRALLPWRVIHAQDISYGATGDTGSLVAHTGGRPVEIVTSRAELVELAQAIIKMEQED